MLLRNGFRRLSADGENLRRELRTACDWVKGADDTFVGSPAQSLRDGMAPSVLDDRGPTRTGCARTDKSEHLHRLGSSPSGSSPPRSGHLQSRSASVPDLVCSTLEAYRTALSLPNHSGDGREQRFGALSAAPILFPA